MSNKNIIRVLETTTDIDIEPICTKNASEFFQTDHLLDNLKERSVRGGAVTLTGQVIKFIVQIVSTMVMARLLKPSDFGLVAMVTAVAGFVAMFKDLGLSQSTIQQEKVTHAQVSTLFWINFILSFMVMILLIILAPVVSWFYKEPRLTLIMLIIALNSITSGLSIQHSAILHRQMKFFNLMACDLVAQILGVVAGIISAILGMGYWALIIMLTVNQIIGMFALWIGCKWRPGLPRKGTGIRPMLLFGGHLTGANFLGYFSQNMDSVLIGYFFGSQKLGFYNRAQNLCLLPLRQLLPPVISAMNPALCRLSNNPERFRSAFLAMLEKTAMVSTFAAILMIAMADWIVYVFLGPQWSETARIFGILSIFAMVDSIASVSCLIFTTLGLGKSLLHWQFFRIFIMVFGLIVGLHWGLIGVATSFVCTGLFIRLPSFFWHISLHSPIKMVDIYKRIIPYIFISGVVLSFMIVIRHLIPNIPPLIGILSFSTGGMIIYITFLSMFKFGRASLNDITSLIKYIKPKMLKKPEVILN